MRHDRRAWHLDAGARRSEARAEQWRARVEQFLSIRPGQVGGGRRKLSGVVDIAMLPSLARRKDITELTSSYGQIIVDECHHLAAAACDHSVKHIGAQFWLGLTATPTRRDGLGEIVSWQLGPVRHTMDQKDQGLLAVDWTRRRCFVEATDLRGRSLWQGITPPHSAELCHSERAILLGAE